MKVYETQEKLDSEEEEEEEKEEEVEGMEEGDRGEVEWAKEVEKKRDMTLFKQTLEKEGIVDCPNEVGMGLEVVGVGLEVGMGLEVGIGLEVNCI